MAFESWDDAMFWHGSLIGYTAGVKSACKDEDKSSLLLRMADIQARLEFMESENAKLRKLVHWMYDCMDESCAVQHPYAPTPINYDQLMQAQARACKLGIEV